jgi:hypothetical protein
VTRKEKRLAKKEVHLG